MAALVSGDRRLGLDRLHENAARAASGLRDAGIGEGDAVAILMRNDFAFFEASLAAGRLGAYATPVNWHFTAEEAGYILTDSGAKALVVHADLYPRIAGAVPPGVAVFQVDTPPEIGTAYAVDPDACAVPAGAAAWAGLVEGNAPLADPPRPLRASMIYTSGTTGRPKGVRRDQPTAVQAARMAARAAITYGLAEGEATTVLMNGPMYHSAPNSYALNAVRIGAEIVLQARFDAEEMLALIERHRITHMHIVPTMFVRLARLPEAVRRRYDVGSLRWVVHGAAPCPPELKRTMLDWWGPVIHEYYGSTETGIVVMADADDARRKPGTIGRPLPEATVKAIDEAGRELPAGEIGELYVGLADHPDFTYHGAPGKRREIDRAGLITVGDAGWIDADGHVFLCDRKRDMVISGGVNVYPAEIEAALIALPGVRDCAVFGIPDAEYGESLCACIEPDPAVPAPTPDGIRAQLARHLARFKIPKRVLILAELPREDSGKIFKRKLREQYGAP